MQRMLNGWPLFWMITLPLCAVMIVRTLASDLASGTDISALIGFSVRWAVPFIYIVLAASAIRSLWPNSFTGWLLRNREQFGMCFAVAMAWQATFIFIVSNTYRDYYYEEIYLFRDELEGSIGYIFLVAMVTTTTAFGRRLVNPKQWKLIHTGGIYFLWAYPFSVYWWSLSYYDKPGIHDYIFYWAGFLAFALRIVAWGKARDKKSETPGMSKALGWVVIFTGVMASVGSLYIQDAMTGFLTGAHWSQQLVLWFPFWPFEPFYSLAIIGLGTWLATHAPTQTTAGGLVNE